MENNKIIQLILDRAADVFVFPSLTDTFGLVVLEAMPAAFPVTGPKQNVINGVNGWMDDDLKTAVTEALKVDPDGCLEYTSRFSWEKCTEQFFADLYRFHEKQNPSKTEEEVTRYAQ